MRDDEDEEEFAPDAAPAGGAVVSPEEPAPSVPASEIVEPAPTPVEQKSKPRKAAAPAAH